MTNKLFQLLLSMRIGDGCYINQRTVGKPTYHLTTTSINADYVRYKESVLRENDIYVSRSKGTSGYGSTKPQYKLTTHTEPEITLVGRMKVDDILDSLDLYGLILYYLDDGTLHKRKHFMHISCNTFTESETIHLIDVMYKAFPIKRCSIRKDRKKDGREFNYIYIPVCVSKEFSKCVRQLLVDNEINSLLYKTIPPSQTIESIE